jgi:CMP-N-acetylneuraminic acid synthetase
MKMCWQSVSDLEFNVPFKRPEELASDVLKSVNDVIMHARAEENNKYFDLVLFFIAGHPLFFGTNKIF